MNLQQLLGPQTSKLQQQYERQIHKNKQPKIHSPKELLVLLGVASRLYHQPNPKRQNARKALARAQDAFYSLPFDQIFHLIKMLDPKNPEPEISIILTELLPLLDPLPETALCLWQRWKEAVASYAKNWPNGKMDSGIIGARFVFFLVVSCLSTIACYLQLESGWFKDFLKGVAWAGLRLILSDAPLPPSTLLFIRKTVKRGPLWLSTCLLTVQDSPWKQLSRKHRHSLQRSTDG